MTWILALTLVLALGGAAAAQTTTHGVYWWLLPGATNTDKTCEFLDDSCAQADTLWTERNPLSCPYTLDFNSSGFVDLGDLITVAGDWGWPGF